MELSAPFSELSRLVERLERSGVDVRGVNTTRRELVVDGVLAVTVELELSLVDALDAPWASVAVDDCEVGGDGRLTASVSVAASLVPDDLAVRATDVEAAVADGVLCVTLPVEIPVGDAENGLEAAVASAAAEPRGPADAAASPDSPVAADASDSPVAADAPEATDAPAESGDSTTTETAPDSATDDAEDGGEPEGDGDDLGAGSVDRGVPVFRDHDRLQAAYDRCDTFAEMRDALGVDVTAETVRRYMIDAGVHDPDTYQTGSGDESAETAGGDAGVPADSGPPDEVLYADGIGLPDGLTVEGLIAVITESNTLYEVSRALDVERGRARDALAELNLLDLVVGRLAMEAEREVTREEVVDRLRAADTGA